MKINDQKTFVELNNYLRGIKDKTQRQAAQVKDIDRVREMVDEVPDIRDVKVKELKGTVEKGTYDVKGEVIAQDMIKNSLIDTIL